MILISIDIGLPEWLLAWNFGQSPDSITFIHLAGVVSGTEVNLALSKPAYQSSVAWGGNASRAVGTYVYRKGIDLLPSLIIIHVCTCIIYEMSKYQS